MNTRNQIPTCSRCLSPLDVEHESECMCNSDRVQKIAARMRSRNPHLTEREALIEACDAVRLAPRDPARSNEPPTTVLAMGDALHFGVGAPLLPRADEHGSDARLDVGLALETTLDVNDAVTPESAITFAALCSSLDRDPGTSRAHLEALRVLVRAGVVCETADTPTRFYLAPPEPRATVRLSERAANAAELLRLEMRADETHVRPCGAGVWISRIAARRITEALCMLDALQGAADMRARAGDTALAVDIECARDVANPSDTHDADES